MNKLKELLWNEILRILGEPENGDEEAIHDYYQDELYECKDLGEIKNYLNDMGVEDYSEIKEIMSKY